MSSPPTREEIFLVARKVVEALNKLRLPCCLFGSTACTLNGTSRTPNDVDMIVMTESYDQETLKRLIASYDRSFYLLPSRKVGETYKILYRRLAGFRRSCKVDVLIPGTLNIPLIPPHRIEIIDNFPVLPLFPLLLLKLQGWSDHRASSRSDMQEKQYVDVRDLAQLLAIAVNKGAHLENARWLPDSFIQAAIDRVQRYVECYRQPDDWRRIGFDV
ncbi:hypothetical protein K474DRAFT_1605084 [Panus rudis PR-1116 ss-1]|nr:hypothetical protein K474DRAFT_1605084 [Panus rudis PR-1116 ss-1]